MLINNEDEYEVAQIDYNNLIDRSVFEPEVHEQRIEEISQAMDAYEAMMDAQETMQILEEARQMANESAFERDLEALINKYSMESGSDTPDFILASYLKGCLDNFNNTLTARTKYYGTGR